MDDLVLHKVIITAEAVFDYEHCLQESIDNPNWKVDGQDYLPPLVAFPKKEIKTELEEYLQNHRLNKVKHYWRIPYYCERLDKKLMLFVLKGNKIGIMQNWELVGICG